MELGRFEEINNMTECLTLCGQPAVPIDFGKSDDQ
jgi:hypothetical protein